MTDVLAAPPEDTQELPTRPRRRLVTPLTAALTAVLIGAGGFIGGVEVQKHHGGSPSAGPAAATSAPAANRFRGGGFGGGGGPRPTVGQVANKRGGTLYVSDFNGNTVQVRTTNAKVTRTASTGVGAVHPGDTVIIQGSKGGDGTISASSVTATAKGAGLFGGGGALFGGGGGPSGGGSGSGSGSQGPSDQVLVPAP
jgi:hypothetical protein